MRQISVAFYWHMHQPYYRDRLRGTSPLPFVRLHCTKGYYDMVSILEDFPNISQTFNLVPSLVAQIEEYADDNASDDYLILSDKSAEDLDLEERTFVLRNFMTQIPSELMDASRIDGCNDMGAFWKIIVPLSKAAFAVVIILQFTWIYNDFFYALILSYDRDVAPVTVGLMLQSQQILALRWEYQMAGAVIATLPTLVVFLAFQRYFIRGIMLGSVKG